MSYLVGKYLIELDAAAQAVAHKPLWSNLRDLFHQVSPHGQGDVVELPLQAHDS